MKLNQDILIEYPTRAYYTYEAHVAKTKLWLNSQPVEIRQWSVISSVFGASHDNGLKT